MMATVMPGQIVESQRRLPPADRREAQRVARVEAVAGVEVTGRVPHRPGQAAEDAS